MTRKVHDPSEWFLRFDESLWLKSDDIGEEDAQFIRRVLRLRKAQAVLDAPCGAGRIAVHLAKAGCKVTGIDITDSFLRRARHRFRKEGVKGRFLRCDMGIRLYTPGQFCRLFEQAGLQVEAMYGNLDGGEYSRTSLRIYMVGRKT